MKAWFKSLMQSIRAMFAEEDYVETLERFIVSKNPTSVADVEYWTAVYERRNYQRIGGYI